MIGLNLPWIIAHLIGDYLLQNDWMAKWKKSSSFVCFVHVGTYMVPFLLTAVTPLQFILIGVQHYIQDRSQFVSWFCRTTNKFQSEVGSKLPWGHFIVDNVFHIVWMWLVITYF